MIFLEWVCREARPLFLCVTRCAACFPRLIYGPRKKDGEKLAFLRRKM